MNIEQLVACTHEADGSPRTPGLFQPIKAVAPGFRIAFSNVTDEIVFEIDGVAQAMLGKNLPKP